MPSLITDYGQDFVVGTFFGRSTTVPTSFWVALLTDIPDASVDGTMLSEPPATSNYTRVQVTNDGTFWGSPAGGVIANIAPVVFPIVQTLDWPNIAGYALCDAVIAGNVFMTGMLRMPRVASVGHLVKFDVGTLTVSVNKINQSIVPFT